MTKLEKLCAAYEAFGRAISDVPDTSANRLAQLSSGVRELVSDAFKRVPKPTPSQIAAGLEQSWRETPMLIQDIQPEWRAKVAEAWHTAAAGYYPEFLVKEEGRLRKIFTRGKIRTEAEFHLVRHEIDILEGAPGDATKLQTLYRLVDSFESR